jgi:N-acyl-phosphatidylethanolamine-hydrolysing phospholipase D
MRLALSGSFRKRIFYLKVVVGVVVVKKSLVSALCFLLLSQLSCTSVLSETLNRPAHHTENGFKNPYTGPITKGPIGFLKMRFFGDDPFADHEAEADKMPIAQPQYQDILSPPEAPQVTWLGHSTFLIQYKGKAILTDPMLSERASPVSFAGPKRLVATPITYADLPAIDYIVISHNHYEHLDLETLEQLGDSPVILVPLKLKEWFESAGLNASRVLEFDWWDQANFGAVSFVATPSQHWSARGLFDRNETLWAAWHIQIEDFSVWFGGDTGYNEVQFKEIGAKFGEVDLGLIPIGAYAPRWFMAQQHIDPEEAVVVHQDIRAKRSIGMHWGTFQLSAEPMFEPQVRLAQAVQEHGLKPDEFVTLAIGETILVDP